MLLISTPQHREATAQQHSTMRPLPCTVVIRFSIFQTERSALWIPRRGVILRAKKGSDSSHSHYLSGHSCVLFHLASPRPLSDSERDSTLTKVKSPPPTKSLTVYCSLSSNCPPHSMYNSSFSSTSPISINGSTNVGRHLPPRAILRRRSPACVRTISHALLPANMPQSIPSGSTQSKLLRQQTLSAWIYGGFVCFLFCNEATC